MFTLAALIFVVVSLATLAAQLWLILLAAHHRRYPWMLAMIFLPFVSLAYSALFWSESKRPFLILALGGPAAAILVVMLIAGAPEQEPGQHFSGQASALAELATPTKSVVNAPSAFPVPATAAPHPPRVEETLPLESEAASAPSVQESPAPPGFMPPAASRLNPLTLPKVPARRTDGTIEVGFAGFLNDRGDVIRHVLLAVTNQTDYPLRKLRLTMYYRDETGNPLKDWTSTYEDPDEKPIAGAHATNEFKAIAFFIPETTRRVVVLVREATLADGTVWRP